MGTDDDGDCSPHMWRTTGVTIGLDGAHVDEECELCGALSLTGPDQLRGKLTPPPDVAGQSGPAPA